jgi:hypothetical protein
MALPAWHPERLAARLPYLAVRSRILAATRAHFSASGYSEIETPALVPSPGAEVHLAAFETAYEPHLGAGAQHRLFLRTSPELAIKRLLAGGVGPVFEIARVWRNGELSARHAPEFTMLEWYRPGLSMAGLMDEAEAYLRAVWPDCPAAPFRRITMAEAFFRWCNGLDILATVRADGQGDAAALQAATASAGLETRADEDWESGFFRLMLEQHKICYILLDLLKGYADCEVLMQHRVIDVAQDADGVTVGVETPEGRKTFRGAYLVGCDGGRSAVRTFDGAAWNEVLVAGGGFRHGQHLASKPGTPLCNLYVSMLQQMGFEVDTFSFSTGTLTGLESA